MESEIEVVAGASNATYPVADGGIRKSPPFYAPQRTACGLELRRQRKPSRRNGTTGYGAWLAGERLRPSDEDVSRVDRLAQTASPEETEEWARLVDPFQGVPYSFGALCKTSGRSLRPMRRLAGASRCATRARKQIA